VPAAPHVQQLAVVAAVGHDPDDVRLAKAFALGGTILGGAVTAFHASGGFGQLGALRGIGRRGHHGAEPKPGQLAGNVPVERLALVAPGFLHGTAVEGEHALAGLRRKVGRIPGDVGRLHPEGLTGFALQLDELGVDARHELLGGLGGSGLRDGLHDRLRLRAAGQGDGGQGGERRDAASLHGSGHGMGLRGIWLRRPRWAQGGHSTCRDRIRQHVVRGRYNAGPSVPRHAACGNAASAARSLAA
jgi:hypothetical protein